MKDKKDEEYKKLINNFSMFLFYIIIIIILIIFVGYWFRVSIKSQGDMFSYSGAVIGGGLTLIGVVITIMYQEIKLRQDKEEKEKQHKEDLAIQYTPMIMCLAIKDLNDEDFKNNIIHEGEDLLLNFIFKNCGRGEAYNLKITLINPNGLKRLKEISWLPCDQHSSISTDYISKDEYTNKILNIKIIFEYTDLYGVFTYQNIVNCVYDHDKQKYIVKNGIFNKVKN